MIHYTYLMGALFVMFVWFILFFHRKDVRREMFIMSSIIAVLGLIVEWLVWTNDWWRPHTFTNTIIGFEDLLFGFGMGGIAAVIYEEVFRQKLCRLSKKKHPKISHIILLFVLSATIGNISYFYFGLSAFQSSILSMFIPTLFVWFLRKDLIKDSLYTGIILTILAFFGFSLMNLIEPGFVQKWWLFEYLSGVVVIGVPLEDIIWFFVAGLFIAPIYEFWQCRRLVRIHNPSSHIVH